MPRTDAAMCCPRVSACDGGRVHAELDIVAYRIFSMVPGSHKAIDGNAMTMTSPRINKTT